MTNLVKQLQETCLTRQELVDNLKDLLLGRSIGPTYIVNIRPEGSNLLHLETDDGCRFSLRCEEE